MSSKSQIQIKSVSILLTNFTVPTDTVVLHDIAVSNSSLYLPGTYIVIVNTVTAQSVICKVIENNNLILRVRLTSLVDAPVKLPKGSLVYETSKPDSDIAPQVSIAIGTVTTGTPVAVTNSGTPQHAILNFTFPEPTVTVSWGNVSSKPTFATVAYTGSYDDLSNKPTIPTLTSQLTNDTNFLVSADIVGKEDKANKGQALGYAPLDANTKIDPLYLPDATIPANSITLDKIQQVPTATVLGRSTAGVGDVELLTFGTGFSFTGTTINVTGGGATYLDDLVDVQLGNPNNLVGGMLLGYDSLLNVWKPTTISVVTSVNGQSGIVSLNTSHISESSNLYYTTTRVDNRVAQLSIDHLADVNKTGWAVNKVWGFDVSGNTVPLDMAAIGGIGFADLVDGNLVSPTNGQTIIWSSAQSKYVLGNPVVLNTTNDLAEGSNNLYYTNSRVDTRLTQLTIDQFGDVNKSGWAEGKVWGFDASGNTVPLSVLNSSVTTDSIPEGSTNLYYTNSRFDTRFDSRLGQSSIDQLSDVNKSGWAVDDVLSFNASGILVPSSLTTNFNSLFDTRLGQSNISALLNVGSDTPQGGYTLVYNATTGLYQPGPAGTVSVKFTYSSSGDTKGVIYWTGTEKLTQSFISPALKSAPFTITVTLSSNLPGTPTYHVIDRDVNTIVHTAGQANSSIILDFGSDKLMKPTDYTIRGRSDANTDHPRNWQIQGSADGTTNWITLDTQTNNTSVGLGSYYKGTCTANEAYRYLRMVQTGANSSGNEYLVLSEIDFYGYLTITGTSAPTTTDDLPEGDTNLYYLNSRVGSYLGSAISVVPTGAIRNNAVTFAKFQQINSGLLLGRSTAGTGDVEAITVGSGLTLSGGTLSAAGAVTSVVGQTGAVTASQIATGLNTLTGAINYSVITGGPTGLPPTGSAGGDLSGNYPNPTIANNAVTFAKFQQVATGVLLGRSTASTGDVETITLGTGLTLSGGVLSNTVATYGSFFAASPTVKNIPLFTATRATTINELRGVDTSAGTATISIQINGVNVTGLTNLSVTSTPQNFTATEANTVSVGARVTVNITAVSSAADLEFTLGATLN